MKRIIFLAITAVFVLASCKQTNAQKEAEGLLKKATLEYEKEKYEDALRSIDSLRNVYPNSIDVRERALILYQDVCLGQAQKNVERLDVELEKLEAEYNSKKSLAEAHHAEGTATEEELAGVNRMRLQRDSLKVKFDTECAKVKLIKQKQKEG